MAERQERDMLDRSDLKGDLFNQIQKAKKEQNKLRKELKELQKHK